MPPIVEETGVIDMGGFVVPLLSVMRFVPLNQLLPITLPVESLIMSINTPFSVTVPIFASGSSFFSILNFAMFAFLSLSLK